MKNWLLVSSALFLALSASETWAARKNVRIYKPSLPYAATQPVYPLAVVPPVLIAFDLIRRTSCDPKIAVSTGKGDPGFDLDGPQVGNFLIPAIWSRCASRPQPK